MAVESDGAGDGGTSEAAGAPDVVGVGALNLDHIVSAAALRDGRGSELRRSVTDVVRRAGVELRAGGEAWVDAGTLRELLACADAVTSPRTVVGGSAFNALRAAARTRTGLRLGFVGVAGRSPVEGVDVAKELRTLGMDARFVRRAPHDLSGVCFSYAEEDGERTLLSHAGANLRFAEYLESVREELVRYLASARVVHVACLVDDAAGTERIGQLLAEVRDCTPPGGHRTRISLDPGHGWSTDPGPAVRRLLGLSDYLLVNRQEFHDLARACGGTDDGAARTAYGPGHDGHPPDPDEARRAAALLRRLAGPAPLIAVKRPDGVDLHRRGGDGTTVRTAFRRPPLGPHQIEDATGAGDVFAGGLLAVLSRRPTQPGLGCRLGMAMARRKLRRTGGEGPGYERVAQRLLGPAGDRSPAPGR